MEAVISNTTYTDTNWHHVAGVRRNGTNYLYIDGVEQTATNTRALNDSGSWAFIGRQYDDYDARYFDGLIDNVRIYNRALSAAEIAQLAEILTYQNFTEAKAGSDTTSITISTPADGGSETVEILGSWTSGLTHTAESGSNRLLIFTGHCEDDDADMDLQSVTYGGQSMTKVIERETEESSIRAYVVAYVLNEAGISAASGSTFLPTWSSTAEVVEYSSVFLQNVNQSSPTGASASNGSNTDSTISTSALSTSNGDMVIVAGTAGYTGTYSVNNGFTEAIELTIYSSDGIAGYKSADGSDETPSITHSDPYRQVIIGFVVQGNLVDPITTIEGDLLVAAVATDGDTSATLAPPGSEGWTEIDVSDYGNEVTLGAWWKLADASESTSHQFTWTGGEQAYGWMMRFTGHDPADPIDVYATDGEFSSSPTSPSVTTSVDDAIILRLGGFDDDDITEDAPGLAGHTAITMDKSASDGSVTYQEFTEAKASSDVTSITVSTPAGTSEGDLLVAAVATDGDTSTSLAPPGGEGWVEINLDQYGSAVTFGVWWKLADASESPSHQFTWSGSEQAYGWIMRFTGHDPTTPINTSNAAGGSSTSPDCPSVTTTVANTMIVRIGGFDDDDITVDSPGLSGHTAITMDESAASSYSCSGGAGYIQQAAIGASGISEFSLTGLLSEQYRTVTIAIAPDPASNTVSGGAGYVKQSASGDSGTSTFSLTESEESRTLTIAIAPDPDSVGNTSSGDCDEVTP